MKFGESVLWTTKSWLNFESDPEHILDILSYLSTVQFWIENWKWNWENQLRRNAGKISAHVPVARR